MKELLEQLEMTVSELADWLLLPYTTVASWWKRGSSVPTKYGVYIAAMRFYLSKRQDKDLKVLWLKDVYYQKWQIKEGQIAKEKKLKEINRQLQKMELQLAVLQEKEQKFLRRWDWSEYLPDYLPVYLREDAHTKDWLDLIGRKSRLKLRDLLPQIRHLQQKIAGLQAEKDFLTVEE